MKDRGDRSCWKPAGRAAEAGRTLPVAGRAFAVLLTAFSLPGLASGQIPPPDDAYVTLRTAHFRVTFPEDLEELSRRAAGHAETAYELFSTGFFEPPGTVDLLVTDRSDLSIGFARVFPTLRITIWAQPPVEGLALSHYDDWLALMVTHEVAHAFHLDYAGAPGRLLRGVFGRVPERWPYFSAQTVPLLAIEGIAVHEEFHSHGSGRLEGTLNEAIVRTRWADGIAESVDQGIGASPIWPGRDRRYVHGGLFFQHLADTRGQDAVVRFLRLVAEQWIPYRLDAAAREAFGSSLEAPLGRVDGGGGERDTGPSGADRARTSRDESGGDPDGGGRPLQSTLRPVPAAESPTSGATSRATSSFACSPTGKTAPSAAGTRCSRLPGGRRRGISSCPRPTTWTATGSTGTSTSSPPRGP